ncbi:hypothetical protein, partial [Streptomyces sp. NPDC002785]|uniref:hypothetical protein n=1 Tax=Streptomyces sp. NPDC002785 TaxID=3154543 RepID=UPI00331B0D4B
GYVDSWRGYVDSWRGYVDVQPGCARPRCAPRLHGAAVREDAAGLYFSPSGLFSPAGHFSPSGN